MKLNKIIKKIVYPHYNGTAVWYKRSRYDVVTEDHTFCFYDWEVIRLLEMFLELELKKEKKDASS